MNSDRLPLRWGNLWRIFWASLDELSFGEMLWRMPLVVAIAYASGYEMGAKNMLKPAEPYAPMVWTYYGVSWLIFVVFRYYFLPSHWFPWMQVAAGFLYGDLGRPDLAVLPCVARTNGNDRRVWSGLDPDPDIAS